MCTASTVIPEEYQEPISEQLVADLAEFAIHARRLNELLSLEQAAFGGVDSFRFKTTQFPVPLETSYKYALNRLIYANTYIVGYSIWDGDKIFLASRQNVIPTYVTTKTDQWPIAAVSIFGVAFCFLTSVIQQVKQHHPSLRF
jgi:hypothetical protein